MSRASSPITVPLTSRTDAEFVAIDQVAALTGVSVGHLRRKVATMPTGMVRQIKPTGGGRAKYHIHRSYDRRLNAAQTGVNEQMEAVTSAPVDLSKYSRSQRQAAIKRASILRRYRRLRAAGVKLSDAVPKMISEIRREDSSIRVSYSRLREWDNDRQHIDAERQWDGLVDSFVDQRGGDVRTKSSLDDRVWQFFVALYLDERKWSVRHAWRMTGDWAKAHDLDWVSYRHCTRLVEERISPSVRTMHREGVKPWERKFGYSLQQNPDAWAANEMWVSDQTTHDFFAQDSRTGKVRPCRLVATTWMDWRTRMILGWHIDYSGNSETIRRSLRMAIEVCGGPPPEITIDHGKDYESEANIGMTKHEKRAIKQSGDDWRTYIGGVFGLLGIETHFSIVENPNGKSRMERWYGTLHEYFDKRFESWCGSNPTEREMASWIRRNPERLPTLGEVREKFAEFVASYNHDNKHTIDDLVDADGNRLSPHEAMEVGRAVRRVLPDPKMLDTLLMRHLPPRRVGKLGVGITIEGTGKKVYYGASDLRLEPYKKDRTRKLRVAYDPDDVSHVMVFEEDWRFVCIANLNDEYGGSGVANMAKLKEGQRLKVRQRKAVKQSADLAIVQLLDPFQAGEESERRRREQRIAEQRKKQRPTDDPDEARLQIVQTPIDEAQREIERERLRQAAGGETTGSATGDAPADSLIPTSSLDDLAREFNVDDDDDEDSIIGSLSFDADGDDDDEFDIDHDGEDEGCSFVDLAEEEDDEESFLDMLGGQEDAT